MSDKQLRLIECFFQADMIKGFRYIDDAGKIMNRWSDDFPEMNVGLEGLTMKNPKAQHFVEARVDSTKIWAHFQNPPTLQYVIDHSFNLANEISTILAVKQFKRVALRLYYAYPVADAAKAAQAIVSNLGLDSMVDTGKSKGSITEFVFSLRIEDPLLSSRIALMTAKKSENAPIEDDRPPFAILIDLDLYSSEVIEVNKTKIVLQRIPRWINRHLDKVSAGLVRNIE